MGKLNTADADFLREARQRFQAGIDADWENRKRDEADRKFYKGEQWSKDELTERKNRITVTINRQPQFVKQVTGEMRQNKPAIRVLPKDDVTDPQLAEVYSAIIRHVESLSDAHRIYNKSAEQACIGGIGWYRILTEYLDDTSFDQEIVIKHVRNPLSVVYDPDARGLVREDMNWAFITEMMSREKFEAAYPDVPLVGFESPNEEYSQWINGDFIRVAEYWYRKPTKRKLALFSDGSTAFTDDVDLDVVNQIRAQQGFPPIEVVREREVESHRVCWTRMTGNAVIDKGEWEGKYIPLIPVVGEEVEVGDEIFRHGLIHHTKDAQKSYNYARSAMLEHVGSQPKAPWLVTAANIKNYKGMWENANKGNPAALVFDLDPANPNFLPQRASPPTMAAAWYQEAQVADDDMKATTGIYDTGLGRQGNETSGRAIIARDQQGETATFVYVDNLSASIRHTGNILIDLIPHIYSDERIIRIMGEDGSIEEYAKINTRLPDGRTFNDITQGRYDIEVTTGPAYATKRQQAADSMMQFVQAVPAAGQVAGDMIAKSMDWPNSDKIADRLKMLLPPGIDPEVDMQRMQIQQQMQQMTGPPPPPPEVMQAQAEAEMQQQKMAAEQQQAQTKLAIQAREAEFQMQLDRQKQAFDMQLQRDRFEFDKALQLEKASLAASMAERNAAQQDSREG